MCCSIKNTLVCIDVTEVLKFSKTVVKLSKTFIFFKISYGLYYGHLYGHNCGHIEVSKSVCYGHSRSPKSNICGQGWSLPEWSP